MNANVFLGIVYTALISFSGGIWGYAVLSSYLERLGGSNFSVGLAEGLQGCAQFIFAIPMGYISDAWTGNRGCTLRVSALLGCCAIIFAILTLTVIFSIGDKSLEYRCMTGSLVLWGAYVGSSNPVVNAIFADSVSSKDRPRLTTYKFIARASANAGGPLLSLILFHFLGDSWSLDQLRIVFLCGISLAVVPVILLLFLKESKTLGRESESEFVLDENDIESLKDSLLESTEDEKVGSLQNMASSNDVDRSKSSTKSKALKWVPRICAFADICSGLASGMTIKFFPLFFRYDVGLSPVSVNAIKCVNMILMALASFCVRRISALYIGRVKTIMFCKFTGISLLTFMWACGLFTDFWTKPFIICPVYILRTVLMNCCYPLQKSILMDFVPKGKRGKWNAFESVTRFGWSGSALIGGVISDNFGYGATFLATAIMQAIALGFTSSLLWYVKK